MANIPFLNNAYFAGKVGIGTASPSDKLEVVGNIRIDSTSAAQLFLDSAAGNDSVINFQEGATQKAKIGYDNSLSGFAMVTGSGPYSTADMVILDSGNVGIGTTSPSQKLQVSGNSLVTGTQFIGDTFTKIQQAGGNLLLTNQSSSGAIRFLTNSTERVRIDSSGNVGIGTTSPSQKLEVIGNVKVSSTIYSPNLATWGNVPMTIRSDDYIRFLTSSSNSERMRILNNGNIGIGTTNPTKKLHVDGNTLISAEKYYYVAGGGAGFGSDASGNFKIRQNGADLIFGSGNNVGIGNTSPSQKLEVTGGNVKADEYLYNATDRTSSKNWKFLAAVNAGTYRELGSWRATEGNVVLRITVQSKTSGNSGTAVYMFQGGFNQAADGWYELVPAFKGGGHGNAQDGWKVLWYESTSYTFKIAVAVPTGLNNKNLNVSVEFLGDTEGDSYYQYNALTTTGTIPTYSLERTTSYSNRNLVSSDSITAQYDATNYTVLGYDYLDTYGGSQLFKVAGTERLRITSTGNVGIGTTSPGDKLEIGNLSNYTGLTVKGAGASRPAVTFKNATQSLLGAIYGTEGRDIIIETGGNGTTGTVALTLSSAGALKLNTYTAGTLVSDASGNITVSSGGGAGGPYLPLAGGTMTGNLNLNDNVKLNLGSGGDDLTLFHNGSTSYIRNNTGNLEIRNQTSGASDILLRGQSANGLQTYITLDGSVESIMVNKDMLLFNDGTNGKLKFGASQDLQIFHDGSNSYVSDTGTGSLILTGTDLQLKSAGDEFFMYGAADGQVALYHNGTKKFETGSTGVTVIGSATATTFLGDLNGTINTATTAVTKANATNDTTVATTAFVQNLIGTIPAGLVFQGTWNAATNTPTLTSGSGTTGHFYIVSTDGSTNLDGITDWKVGDWAVFVEQGASDQWEKVDNSSVLDGSGTGQKVTKWDGSGTSNTLTDGPITFSGNNSTFAGTVYIPSKLEHTGDSDTFLNFSDDTITLSAGGSSTTFAGNGSATFAGALTIPDYIYHTGDANTKFGFGGNDSFQVNTSGAVAFSIDTAGNATFAGDVTIPQYLKHTNDADTYFGFSASNQVLFHVGGSDRLIINSAGNVGIGTTSPSSKLEVEGTGELSFKINNTQYTRSLIITQGGGYSHLKTSHSSGVAINYGQGNAGILSLFNNTTQAVKINANGDSYFNGGNVGIGTTSPAAKLSIVGTSGTGIIQHLEGSASYGATTRYSRGGSYTWQAGVGGNATGNDIPFSNFGIVEGSTTRFVIGVGGNVGIGTTSPGEKLEVDGIIKVVHTDNSYANYRGHGVFFNRTENYIAPLADNTSTLNIGYNGAKWGNIEINGAFIKFENGPNEFMRVDSSGRLLINATSTAFNDKLYVNSDAYATGGWRVGTSTTYVGKLINDGGKLTLMSDGSRDVQIGNNNNPSILYVDTSEEKVGIGTTSPGTALQVGGLDDGSNYDITVGWNAVSSQAVGTKRSALTFKTSQTGVNNEDIYKWDIAMLAAPATVTGEEFGSDLAFLRSTRNSTATDATTMILTRTGNVGIGTTSPDYKFEVQGVISSADAGLQKATFANVGNDLVLTANADATNATAKMLFNSSGSGGAVVSTKMIIDGSGNVGIGTTSPGAKLDVTGNYGDVIEAVSGSQNITTNFVAPTTGSGLNNIISTGGEFNIGTSDAQPFDLVTNSISRIAVLSGGNVGIGTTSPSEKLHVAGYAKADTGFKAGNYTILNESGNETSLSNTAYYPMFFKTNNSTRMTISNAGNVGIGTTSPDSLLHVAADVSGANVGTITIEGRPHGFLGDDIATIDFHNNGTKLADIRMERGNASNDSQIVISTSDAGTLNDALIINEVGNVGIGTASPSEKLGVFGNIRLENGAQRNIIGPTNENLGIFANPNGSDEGILFSTDNGVTTEMIILNGGNVGIGTTSPGQKLDVNGSINVSSNVFAEGFYGDRLWNSNNAALRFGTNNTERARIDGNGNLGIGTTAPTNKLHIQGSQATVYSSTDSGGQASAGTTINNTNTAGNTNNFSQILFTVGTNNNSVSRIVAIRSGSDASDLAFVGKSAAGVAEYMRIKSGGNVGIGTTSPSSSLEVLKSASSTTISEARISSLVTSGYGGQANLWLRTSNYGNAMLAFGNQVGSSTVASSASGKISYNTFNRMFTVTADSNALLTLGGSNDRVGINQTSPQYTLDVTGNGRFTSTVTATNFINSSDERLKENIEEVCNNNVEVNWKTFNFKAEKEQKRYGVIAQELEKTNPEFVREDSKGFKSVAYIDLLIAKIAELEARIQKLEK